ncbi:MAG TPA: toxin-antitoxin system HicB family antitoxin [Thermoanaerobaculia bacterium]|nr:toxin-antitoxin system HicB family antitoxin [Thermoanaerobaculia bacterium]
MPKDLAYYLSLHYPVEIVTREAGCFATHPLLEGCMAEGATAEEAIANLADSRELWIEARLAGGHPVPEPSTGEEFSGRISLRMAPSLHARLAELADRKKISLNLLINTVLAEYVGGAGVNAELQDILTELRASLLPSEPLPRLRARNR